MKHVRGKVAQRRALSNGVFVQMCARPDGHATQRIAALLAESSERRFERRNVGEARSAVGVAHEQRAAARHEHSATNRATFASIAQQIEHSNALGAELFHVALRDADRVVLAAIGHNNNLIVATKHAKREPISTTRVDNSPHKRRAR